MRGELPGSSPGRDDASRASLVQCCKCDLPFTNLTAWCKDLEADARATEKHLLAEGVPRPFIRYVVWGYMKNENNAIFLSLEAATRHVLSIDVVSDNVRIHVVNACASQLLLRLLTAAPDSAARLAWLQSSITIMRAETQQLVDAAVAALAAPTLLPEAIV
jgi:hypothetical protein